MILATKVKNKVKARNIGDKAAPIPASALRVFFLLSPGDSTIFGG